MRKTGEIRLQPNHIYCLIILVSGYEFQAIILNLHIKSTLPNMMIGLLRRLHIWWSWVRVAEWQLATTDDVPGFLTLKDGTDRLYQYVGKE